MLSKSIESKNIAFLVDGQRILHNINDLNLKSLSESLEQYGDLIVKKILLNQSASDNTIETAIEQGFSPIVINNDNNIDLVLESLDIIYNPNIQSLALMTKDINFIPIINKAKQEGKQTILINEQGFSQNLK